ncbi:unnamed protein product [Clavelina lepadiformis]|uniref:Uncharacterized protein n=1 Tax=Clavelina lepadiformis TaxID=159417 RepID=A0ABP0F1E6_CLALP
MLFDHHLVSAMTTAMAVATSHSVFPLSHTLYRLSDEEKKELAEKSKKILQSQGQIDVSIIIAYVNKKTHLREVLLNNMISFIETEAGSLFPKNNHSEGN